MTEKAQVRGSRKSLVGVVASAKMDKTRRVEVPRLQKHAKYGKYMRRKTVCLVHDENNQSRQGDIVEIEETRPLSKTKRWRLLRVVTAVGDQAGDPAAGSDQGAGTGATTA